MRLTLSFLLLLTFTSCAHKSHHKGHHKSHKTHHGHSGHSSHHRFQDAEKWSRIFEAEKRDKWQKPDLVIKTLNIRKTDHIADIGSATGYFPVRLAKKASQGMVYGVDIEPNLVEFLNKRAQKEKISNLISILGTTDSPMIPKPVNMILSVDTYHHISNRPTYFKNLKSSLKKGGRIVIIDFKKGDLPVGPKDRMKIAPKQVINELKEAGYFLKESHDILPYQFILVFSAK